MPPKEESAFRALAERIIAEIDNNENRMIDYTEFLSATLSLDEMVNKDRIRALFKIFDTDASGALTASNIQNAMQKIGKEYTLE